jgi:hypothetical protein
MPRLDATIGPDGPIIEVRLWVVPEDAANFAAAGLPIPAPVSVPGLVDTGAEVTAIGRPLTEWLGVPASGVLEARSAVLGDEARVVDVYRIRMTFGPAAAPDPPKWRTVDAVGVSVVSPGATVLIGRDLLATCRFTYDGRKRRLMISY